MLKKYDVEIYGRKNTIIGAIRNERLYHEVVLANNKKDAMNEALNNFECFMSEVWNELITRRDIRIECEYVSWLDHSKDDGMMIYINNVLLK